MNINNNNSLTRGHSWFRGASVGRLTTVGTFRTLWTLLNEMYFRANLTRVSLYCNLAKLLMFVNGFVIIIFFFVSRYPKNSAETNPNRRPEIHTDNVYACFAYPCTFNSWTLFILFAYDYHNNQTARTLVTHES